ncbi:LysR family transcriptional regulator [Pseudoroseomonas wenyumeiae]
MADQTDEGQGPGGQGTERKAERKGTAGRTGHDLLLLIRSAASAGLPDGWRLPERKAMASHQARDILLLREPAFRIAGGSMDRFEAMSVLLAVVEEGLSAASRRLRAPLATVSRKVADLERHLGIRLLVRTSRRVEPHRCGA